jgi:hypothetical protein
LLSFNDQAALLAQRISNVSIGALSELRLLYVNMSFFFGDTWRASSRLSLTYGVRWEHNPPPTEASGRTPLGLANINDIAHSPVAPAGQPLYRNRYANFAPRLGVAYQIQRDPGREFVVRGGVGIFYDLGTSQAVGGFLNYPFQLRTSLSNQPYPLTLAQILPPVPVTMPPYPGSSGTYDPDANLPYTVQWNVALEKALGASQTVSLTYSAALGRRLVSRFTDAGFPASFRNPNFLTDNFVRNILSSDYHALEVQFRRRLARGLQALGSYVWSHAIDDASDDTSTTLRRGDADMDRRQAFKAAVSYDLPTVASRRALSTVLSHWALDGLISAVTGPPQGFTLATSLGPDGTPIYRTLDLVFGVPIYIDDPHSPGGRRINGAAFASAPSNQIGTLGRNALRGPPLNQTDLSLRREFVVKERLRLQARLDAFNLLNHPNFGLFNLGVSRTAANFGQASSMYGRGLASGAGGFSPLYQIGGPRTLQLSLKLVF